MFSEPGRSASAAVAYGAALLAEVFTRSGDILGNFEILPLALGQSNGQSLYDQAGADMRTQASKRQTES